MKSILTKALATACIVSAPLLVSATISDQLLEDITKAQYNVEGQCYALPHGSINLLFADSSGYSYTLESTCQNPFGCLQQDYKITTPSGEQFTFTSMLKEANAQNDETPIFKHLGVISNGQETRSWFVDDLAGQLTGECS